MDDLKDLECFIRFRHVFRGESTSIHDGRSEKMIGMGECVLCRGRREGVKIEVTSSLVK